MSDFKYYRNNKHRYNIYESHTNVVEPKSFYLILRNSLFLIALILSLLITSLVSFDTYKKKENTTLATLKVNAIQQKQIKNEITKLELTQAISNSIIKKIDKDNAFKDINYQQLKGIIKNVMEKVENSPNQVIYTQK